MMCVYRKTTKWIFVGGTKKECDASEGDLSLEVDGENPVCYGLALQQSNGFDFILR